MSLFRRPRVFGGPQPLGDGELPALARDLGLADDAVAAFPASNQVVHRLIGRSDPRERDFESNQARENPRFPKQDFLDYVGLSVYGSLETAKESATQWPKLIARLRLRPGNGFMIARTLVDIDDHYSIWGEVDRLLTCVESVERFDPE